MLPLILIECSGFFDNADGIVWCQHQCQWHDMTRKVIICNSNLLDLTNAMLLLTMSSASHAVYVNANGSTWPKSHAAPHFNHFDIRNGMMPLMTPSVSCDTSVNGLTWPSCTSFNCLDLRNKMMSFSMSLAPCYTNTCANGITCTRGHVSPDFDHFDLINIMVPLTTALAPQRYSRHCLDII